MTTVRDTSLCDKCGHPRHVHVEAGEYYPALCTHADPRAVDREDDPWAGVCMCLEFVEAVPDA